MSDGRSLENCVHLSEFSVTHCFDITVETKYYQIQSVSTSRFVHKFCVLITGTVYNLHIL